MSINVGINENLVIVGVSKNDKDTLNVKFQEAGEIDPIAALNGSGSTQFNKAERDIPLYRPSVTNFNKETDTPENILKKIAEVKDPLDSILRQYTTTQNIKWDIFAGTGIVKENFNDKLTSQETLDKIYENIVEQFSRMMKPFISPDGKKMRVMLIRQSAAKHYPAFRKRFLESYPFIEPMDVPASASKLRFSEFEIKNKLNDGTPVGGAQTVPAEEKTDVATLFTNN